jgi:hypothetical protein
MTVRARLLTAAATAVLLSGILSVSAGYGLYYRSDTYRHDIEAGLTDFFGLPVEVGRVEAHTLRSRVFRDVSMWLPDRRDRICSIPVALWMERGGGPTPDLQLDLTGGSIAIGSAQWQTEDYWRVLRAAFTRNLTRVNLRQVRLNGIELTWPQMRITAERVTGRIDFDDKHDGTATLVTDSLNGHKVADPIHIQARLEPAADDFVREVRLTVPPLPLQSLQLDSLLGTAVTSGQFQGTIAYRQNGGTQTIQIAGNADGINLRELTGRIPFGPIEGRAGLRIEEAELQVRPQRDLRKIHFAAKVDDLELGPLLQRAGYPNVRGRTQLSVDDALIADGEIRQLLARGELRDCPMESLTRQLGAGVITGTLRVKLDSLQILNDELSALNATLDVLPMKGRPGTIERRLLLGVLRESLGLPIPRELESMIPEQIEYSQMGGKLFVENGQLRVFGSAASDHQSVVTLRLLGQDFPIPPPKGAISLASVQRHVRTRARAVDFDQFKRWWLTTAPASRPHAR